MISVEAFKSLEASLSLRLQKKLGTITKPFYSKIEEALVSGNPKEAEDILNRVNLVSLFEGETHYVAYITKLAMLFGASRVTSKPDNSVVGLGYEELTQTQMVDNFKNGVTLKIGNVLKTTGLQLIANYWSDQQVQKAEPKRVLLPFKSFMDASGKTYLDITSSLHTSRVSAYGFTAEALVLGLTEYQINEQLDNRICPVCRMMHGKTFKVKDARGFLDRVARVTDTEEIKNLQPWPKQTKAALEEIKKMSSEELVAAGWHVPPFHPKCRGLLSRVGKVPSLDQIDSGNTKPKAYTANPEDFKALGLEPTEDLIKAWGRLVPVPPSVVVAQLKGVPLPKLLEGLLTAENKAAYSGILGIKVTDAGLEIQMKARLYDSIEETKNVITIKDKSIALESLELSVADQSTGVAKKYMQGLYSLTSDLGKATMEVTSGLDLGGYAWARYGFRPNLKQWEALKKDVKKAMKSPSVVKYMVDAEVTPLLDTLLSSSDPATIYVLADLSYKLANGKKLGEVALAGTSWKGALDMSDPEAVEKFLTYLGSLE